MSKAKKKVSKYKKDRMGQKYTFNLQILRWGNLYRLHEGNDKDIFDQWGYSYESFADFCSTFSRITGIKLREKALRKYKVTFERIA